MSDNSNSRVLALIRVDHLVKRSRGNGEVLVALLDGPVDLTHAAFAKAATTTIGSVGGLSLTDAASQAHGTFMAGVLFAERGSGAPGLCPDCSFFVRPVLRDGTNLTGMPTLAATPDELAEALYDVVEAGAFLVNASLGLTPTMGRQNLLEESLRYAHGRGVIVVAAAGNQGTIGSSVLTRHAAVIPVAACDLDGFVAPCSNLGTSVGHRGVLAPGTGVTSLAPQNALDASHQGTSVSTSIVTGAIALLWSESPRTNGQIIRQCVLASGTSRRSIVPPLFNGLRSQAALQRAISNQRTFR